MPGILQDIGKFLPTAGAIALPAIADVASGGLALPADAALAGVGGALGKAGENATQGQNPLQANDLTAGAEGAVGAGVGMGVGSLAGKALGAVANPAMDAADNAMMRQFGGQLDRGTARYLTSNGIYNSDEATSLAPQITGSAEGPGAALTKGVSSAVGNSTSPIDLSTELVNFESPLKGYPGVGPGVKSDINGTVNDIIQQAIDESGGQPGKSFDPSQFTPSAAFKASQALRTAANTASTGARAADGSIAGTAGMGKAAAGDVYNGLAKQIEDKVFGTDETGSPVIPIGDADKQALKDSIASLQQSNPKLYATLSGQIDSANSWADIRSAQQPFVKVNQAARAAQTISNKTPGASVVPTSKTGLLAKAARAAMGGDKGETTMLGRLGATMGKPNANRTMALLGGIPGVVAATSPNMVQGQGNTMQPTAAMIPGQDPNQQQMGPSPLALQAAGGFAGMLDPYTAASYAPSFNAAMPQLQQAQQGNAALQGVEQAFAQAGGGQGRLGGLGALLGGQMTGGAPMAYQQSESQLAPILSKLGIQAPLPSLMNTQGAANTQFENIQRLLQALL